MLTPRRPACPSARTIETVKVVWRVPRPAGEPDRYALPEAEVGGGAGAQVGQVRDQPVDADAVETAAVAQPQRDGVAARLPVTDHRDVRDPAVVGPADPGAQGGVRRSTIGPQAPGGGPAGDQTGLLGVGLADGKHQQLYWGQPRRERPVVLLGEVSDQAFHRRQHPAVDHHRPLARAIGADEAEVETFRLVEIDLYGRQGLLPARWVGDLDVDLRPVERGLAWSVLKIEPEVGERGGQLALRVRPEARAAEVALAAAAPGQPVARAVDAEQPVAAAYRLHAAHDLVLHLPWGAEHVGVVEVDLPDPGQAAEHAGQLAAEHAA